MKVNEVIFTGFNIYAFAVTTSGTRQLDDVRASRVIFYNQNNPSYRVFRTDQTGDTIVAYLKHIVVNSGVANAAVEIDGIRNLSQLSVQKHGNGDPDFTGICWYGIAY